MRNREPFRLHLLGCTIADIDAVAAEPRRVQAERDSMFRVHTKGGVLVLRNIGSGRSVFPWSLKARIEEDSTGVLLTGQLRHFADHLFTGMCAFCALFLLALSLGMGLSSGRGNTGVWVCLFGGIVLGSLALVNVALSRGRDILRAGEARRFLWRTFDRTDSRSHH